MKHHAMTRQTTLPAALLICLLCHWPVFAFDFNSDCDFVAVDIETDGLARTAVNEIGLACFRDAVPVSELSLALSGNTRGPRIVKDC